ncbi:uncharacterized protein LOC123292777 [Chrysoperla carnea]|uniref:uncharacterized protein LOC123292777 n=1 Tax=Chrysoperla carnea TaxID=189513 RepID=UPI001D08C261|nr:uncharacterized protein LOC123292777 [Chrysoperla carnea]
MFLVNPPDEIETENLPIYALFPSLRVHYPESSSFLNREVSTTDIAKSLVGEKPNFSVLKTSAKLLPSKIMLESIQELPVDPSDDDDDNETNIEYYKVMADSISKEIGDASKKAIENQCSVHRSSKTEIVQHTFPCTYPPENQIKGLWYESNSENNFIHTTERIKKNITKTEKNPEI